MRLSASWLRLMPKQRKHRSGRTLPKIAAICRPSVTLIAGCVEVGKMLGAMMAQPQSFMPKKREKEGGK
jgi:signal recognition particle subunit SEC65